MYRRRNGKRGEPTAITMILSMNDFALSFSGKNDCRAKSSESNWSQASHYSFLVAAQINLDELNDLLDFNLPLIDEYQTLGGFLVYHWQKIPQLDETFYFDRFQFTIVDIDGPRINQIKITIAE